MSTNKNLTTELEDSKEEMLYRPQLLKYKYKTCLEKARLTDTYDPDTMNSLKQLMQTTNINMNPKKTFSRYSSDLSETTPNMAKSQTTKENKNLLPQWIK